MIKLNFIFLVFLSSTMIYAQNVGIGTSTPAQKLHVAGTFRADALQTATSSAATTDKMVWADANGKIYAFPVGSAGKILGVNGSGTLAWLNSGMSTTLNNGQIWIGDAANTAQPQTMSGDAVISNTGVVTIQDNAVDGTDITISGEATGSLMYFNGSIWINMPIGTAGQVMSIVGGVPIWVSLPAAPTFGNLTTSTSGVSITGGTSAVIGSGITVNVATNALSQNGLVTGPTLANANQVWGTDASGNPSWRTFSAGWGLTGNASTTTASNFMGSTDNVDVAFRTNNLEIFRMTNAQKLLLGVTTPSAPSTQKMEVFALAGDALYAHSPNVGGWLGYETNFTVGTAGTLQGSGVWASNPGAGYTSFFAQSSGSATVAAAIDFSTVWIASYNLVDNSSATFNPSSVYAQLNNTSTTMGGGAFKSAIYGFSSRGTTTGNPGYTVGIQGLANSQYEDAIGVVGRAYCSSGFTLGGYFEGNTYAGVNSAYAYVGGNDGFGATKIVGTGAVSEVIATPNHGRIKLFCPESPEYWYQEYGTAELVNGKAHVELDPILVEIIVVDAKNPMRVFATPVNMLYFEGITIVNQTPTSFDLVELNGATHSGKVDYQLICKPKTNFGQGRFPQGRGPAWLKPDMEPAAAKAANRPTDIFYWPAEHIQYGYNPEEMVPIGEIVPAGPNAGKVKLGNGKFSNGLPMDKTQLNH